MSGMGSWLGHQAVASPRHFRYFPKDWGRKVRWFDIKSGNYISAKRAEAIFRTGKPVGYVASRFTYAIVYDPNGPERS